MENGEVALGIEIEELTLDRPPCSILTLCTDTEAENVGDDVVQVEDIFKDINSPYINFEAVGSSRLATCLIDKPLSCQEQDGTFDPLSSSEKNIETESYPDLVSSECVPDDSDNDIVEIHSPDLNITKTEKIHVVSSSTLLSPQLQNIVEYKSFGKKQSKHSVKRKLVSCLKPSDKGNNVLPKNGNARLKCVHFNESQAIVTESIEPVNPWKDMRTPSKAEVVSFYKNVCQKMKCKHLDKLVKQIQEIPDLSARSGTLVLRGCRLDNRSCEALESVFKRVQFENLDLENCSLEEDGATAILEMIEFYHSTCKLNIACNPKIGLRGWQALCRMLRKTPCLTYLDARRTILTEMTMPTFGRCLKADPYLKVLHLEGVFLSGRPLLILTTALKYNRILEELYIGDNDLTSGDGPSIGAMLTYNTTLQLLDLRNNQIKDIGLAHIGNGLSDQSEQPCGGLCSLIMWNNGLTHEGMSYLCEGLVKTTTLKALNLGQNRIGDLGLQKLKPGLIKNKSLRKLGFLNTKLGSEGAVALAEVLADSWSITRIDIRENNAQTAGLMAFAMALKVNQSLLRLDLDKDIRKEPGMETVMQSVLVDIYNLCYRNKQLMKRSITPSSSISSTHSISTSTNMSRQSSTSSEINEPFSGDDVFHPETANHEVLPYSPCTTGNTNPMDVITSSEMLNSLNKVTPSNDIHDLPGESSSTESLGNSIYPVFENLKRNRTYSDPIRKNPDPGINARRGSRFSVTKILDSLGNHAAGVANKIAQMDNKLKKQHSKERMDSKSSELVPVLDQNQPIQLGQLKGTDETDCDNEISSKIDDSDGLTNENNDGNRSKLESHCTIEPSSEAMVKIAGDIVSDSCTNVIDSEEKISSSDCSTKEINIEEVSITIQALDIATPLHTVKISEVGNEFVDPLTKLTHFTEETNCENTVEKDELTRNNSVEVLGNSSVAINEDARKVNSYVKELLNNIVEVNENIEVNDKTSSMGDGTVLNELTQTNYKQITEDTMSEVSSQATDKIECLSTEVDVVDRNCISSVNESNSTLAEGVIIDHLNQGQPSNECLNTFNEITCENLCVVSESEDASEPPVGSPFVDINISESLSESELTIGVLAAGNSYCNTDEFVKVKAVVSEKHLDFDLSSNASHLKGVTMTEELTADITNPIPNETVTSHDSTNELLPENEDSEVSLKNKLEYSKNINPNSDNIHSDFATSTGEIISSESFLIQSISSNFANCNDIDLDKPLSINSSEQFSTPTNFRNEIDSNEKIRADCTGDPEDDSSNSLKQSMSSNSINDDTCSTSDTIYTSDATSSSEEMIQQSSEEYILDVNVREGQQQSSEEYILDVNVREGQQPKTDLLALKLDKSPSAMNGNIGNLSNELGIEYDGSIEDQLNDLGEYCPPLAVGQAATVDLPS